MLREFNSKHLQNQFLSKYSKCGNSKTTVFSDKRLTVKSFGWKFFRLTLTIEL